VFEIEEKVEADLEGVEVRASRGVFTVYGFDDDATRWLKSSCEQVVEQSDRCLG